MVVETILATFNCLDTWIFHEDTWNHLEMVPNAIRAKLMQHDG